MRARLENLFDFANRAARIHYLLADIEEQRARAAGEVEHLVELVPLARFGLLAFERNDSGENVGDLLRGVELAIFLTGARSELTDEIFEVDYVVWVFVIPNLQGDAIVCRIGL